MKSVLAGRRLAWGPRARAPLLAVLGALLAGAALMLATGHDPVGAYAAMLRGAFGGRHFANLAATLNRATPVVGMGLAAAVAFRAGFFNLGGEGQLVLGGLAAALAALHLPLPDPLLLPAALLAAALAGGLYAWLAAAFQFRFRVPLLVTTLLMNYPARLLAAYLVNHPFRDVSSGMAQSFRIPGAAEIPPLLPGARLHLGGPAVLLLVLVVAFVVRRTVAGYRIRLAGLNPRFARYGGVDLPGLGYRVLFASGALAGVVGAIQVLAVHQRYIDGALTLPLYAWTGLMAALLAGSRPLGVLAAGLLFAAVQTGGFGMERAAEVPRELSRILQALIILMVAAQGSLRLGRERQGGGGS